MRPFIILSNLAIIISSLFITPILMAQLYMVDSSYTLEELGPVINTEAITLFRKKNYFNFRQTDIATKVSFDFSDMKITSEEISSPLVFGASSRNTMNIVNSQPIFQDFKNIGSPSPTLFTNSRTELTDFSITYNYGVCIFASVRHLSQSRNPEIGEKIEYGMLNINFNRGISNPILHINGMGSLLEREEIERGFSIEFELVNQNINLQKLSGTENLIVDQGYISNNSNRMGANYGLGAASGSILVEGNDILNLQFRVFVKRDQRKSKYRGRWPLLRNIHPGDALLIGISFENDYDLSLEFRPEGIQPELSEFLNTELEGNIYFNLVDQKTGLVLASRAFRENTSTVISGLTPESTYRIGFSDIVFEIGSSYVQIPIVKSINITSDDSHNSVLTPINEYEFEYLPIEEKDTKLSFKIDSKFPLLSTNTGEIVLKEEFLVQNELNQEAAEGINPAEVKIIEDETFDVSQKDHVSATTDFSVNDKSTLQDSINEDFPLAIIVGSFVEMDNANRMEQILINKGVSVYRGQGPVEFTRVGIKLDGKSRPAEILNYYRETIALDAWYLYEYDRIPSFNSIGFIETISNFGK